MTYRRVALMAALPLLAACGDGGTDPGISEMTVSAEGGTVTSADGRVTLLVPANALSQATAIRIRRAPPSNDGRLLPGSEYVFEPDGLILLRIAAHARFRNDLRTGVHRSRAVGDGPARRIA